MKKLKHSFDDLLSSVSSAPASSEIEQIILLTTPRREKKTLDFHGGVKVSKSKPAVSTIDDHGQFNPMLFQFYITFIDKANQDDKEEIASEVEDVFENVALLSDSEVCRLVRYSYTLRLFTLSEKILVKYMKIKCNGASLISAIEYHGDREISTSQLQKIRLWLLYTTLFKFEVHADLRNTIEKNRRIGIRKSVASTNLVEYSTLLDCLYVLILEENEIDLTNPFV